MEKEDWDRKKSWKKSKIVYKSGTGGLWFVGAIGTFVYFLHYHSGTFALVVLAIVKAVFWPGFLTFYVLRFMRV